MTIPIKNHTKNMMHRRGFTLIEIMVVMAIIGIVTAVTIVSFGSGKERKAVEGQARKVAAAIREMQNYALTGKQIGTNVPCKFGVISITSMQQPTMKCWAPAPLPCGTAGTFRTGIIIRWRFRHSHR